MQTSIFQQICITAGLLPGKATDEPLMQKAIAWALGKDTFVPTQPTALQPVLATLGSKSLTTTYRFDPCTLNISAAYFPKQGTSPPNVQPQVNILKKELEQHNGNLTQMLRVLEWQGSSIAYHPSFPDLSVYDVVKIASGIAHCLSVPQNSGNLRLLSASVGGIQTYLYDIISQSAAKLLKGRSFYLQLLIESLLQELLQALHLSPYHVIYASGGGFYLIVPDTPDIKSKVEEKFRSVSAQIFATHKTTLFVDWAISPVIEPNYQIDAIWSDMMLTLGRKRFRRLANNPALMEAFFKPSEYGGTAAKDQITNIEFEPGEDTEKIGDDGVVVSKTTYQQIQLGRELRDSQIWITAKGSSYQGKNAPVLNDPFGNWHWLENKLPQVASDVLVRKLNKLDDQTPTFFYGGNEFPVMNAVEAADAKNGFKAGDVKTFDQLATGADLKRLGVLRMDVDSLGTILSDHISTSYGVNLARYVAVSRSLDWFFKGHINELQKAYKDHTLIIYSGGDDLFILGRWSEVLMLAKDIRAAFKKWIGLNPNLTISGGMSIIPGKFPIMQAAAMAKRSEEDAKSHKLPGKENPKNAFTLFDSPLNWEEEFTIVESLHKEMLSLMQQKKLSRSFLTKISSHALSRRFQIDKKVAERWRWVMAWDMSRYRDSLKASDAKAFVEQVIKDAFSNKMHKGVTFSSNYHYLDLLLVAARWTELQRRTETKD